MLSKNGLKVFEARMAARNNDMKVIETFEEAVKRLAQVAAWAERDTEREFWQQEFEEILGNLLFVPSTPIWANMGKHDMPWQPGACFVLGVKDSLHSMYQTLQNTAMVHKTGGGTGYNFSKIRPKGDLVRSTKGKASGVVELIKLYDASASMVEQGGMRRGASIGILNANHPEIFDFIAAKRSGGIVNFNLSVGITDEFMEALEGTGEWPLVFNRKLYDTVDAHFIWNEIAEAAHECGDPGIVFVDRLQRDNPVPKIKIDATNPCGEQPLAENESCLLGSINLPKMIVDGEIDRVLLEKTIQTAVRFLDNMIDQAQYPLNQIERSTKATRKIGLGFTGLADVLAIRQLAYDSEEGRKFAGDITYFMQTVAHQASERLAEEKGCFPEWENSVFYPDTKRRNAACITIAPTGSVTTMAGCEGYGVEPFFAVAYTKDTAITGRFEIYSQLFLDACRARSVTEDVLSEVARKGSCQSVSGIPNIIKKVFKGAQEISFTDHILMQAAVQRHVDNAVSKTVNLPSHASVKDVKTAYALAWGLDLKGITVFRDGSKKGTISVGEQEAEWVETIGLARGEIMKRPSITHGHTEKLDTGCGKLYLTINRNGDGDIVETFVTTGSDGGCLIYTEAVSRLMSLAVRGGISVHEIASQLKGTHACPSYVCKDGTSPGKSCPSAIANKLMELIQNPTPKVEQVFFREVVVYACPECGSVLNDAERCATCIDCGFTKC